MPAPPTPVATPIQSHAQESLANAVDRKPEHEKGEHQQELRLEAIAKPTRNKQAHHRKGEHGKPEDITHAQPSTSRESCTPKEVRAANARSEDIAARWRRRGFAL
jgi:hypothetical protein